MIRNVPAAYCYVRHSTMGQSAEHGGDSEARQIRDVTAWCERHGYATDPSRIIVDRGQSGFAGAHLVRGKLGEFLQEVELGRVTPGSILVVEDYDRIARLPIGDVQDIVSILTKRRISIGVVSADQVLDATSRNDLGSVLSLVVRAHLANEESAKKSIRSKSMWEARRRKAATGKIVSTIGPRWLDQIDGRWVENEHAETIRTIYRMAIEGFGINAIAAALNRDGVSVLTRPGLRVGRGGQATRWVSISVIHVLRSHATYGALVSHVGVDTLESAPTEVVGGIVTRYKETRRRVAQGDPVLDYYPATVDRATWDRAQAAVASRKTGGGGKGTMKSVLQSVIRCSACGGRVQLSDKGRADQNTFYCLAARQGVCAAKGSVRSLQVITAVLDRAVNAFDIVSTAASPERKRLENEAALLVAKRDRLQGRIDALMADDDDDGSMLGQVRRFASQVRDLEVEIIDVQRRAAATSATTPRPAGYEELVADYHGADIAKRDRACRLLNAALRLVIDRVAVSVSGEGAGRWIMTTVNDWARIRWDWSEWQTDGAWADEAAGLVTAYAEAAKGAEGFDRIVAETMLMLTKQSADFNAVREKGA